MQVDGPGVDGPGSDAADGETIETGEAENTANNSPGKAAQVNIGENGGLGEKDQTSHNSNVDNIVKEGSTNISVDHSEPKCTC